MWQHDTQGCTVRKGGGGERKKKCLTKRVFIEQMRLFLSDDKCKHILAAEWMNETRKKTPNNLRILPPFLPCQHRRVAVRESSSKSKSSEFFFFFPPHPLKSLREEEHKSGDGDRRARHLDGKVPHTVLSSCIAPSAGLQRHHWTYETALHMNGERESPAWTLAAADPSPASGTVIPVQALYIILHNT